MQRYASGEKESFPQRSRARSTDFQNFTRNFIGIHEKERRGGGERKKEGRRPLQWCGCDKETDVVEQHS
jgi:hypothetical protein